jgi:NTE family protein
MRASFAIPLFFTPFKLKGVDLVDGGILNPVPIAPTSCDDTDITIAVNLNGTSGSPIEPVEVNTPSETASSPFREKINRFIGRLQPPVRSGESRDWGAYEIATQAFDAMQSAIARQKLAAYPPDRVIEIARNSCGTMEFYRAAEMIALGYEKARMCDFRTSAGGR